MAHDAIIVNVIASFTRVVSNHESYTFMRSPLPLHSDLTEFKFNSKRAEAHNLRHLQSPNPTQERQQSNSATIAPQLPIPLHRLSHLSRTVRMASTSHPNSPPEAPWKSTFASHVSSMHSPEFVFSSLHPSPQKDTPVPYVPRARYCIFRSFWAELPENKHNTAPKNDRIYESDLPTFTTDVRMQKTFELFNSSSGHADSEKLVQGSGGGGPCEAVFWCKEKMVQWRIKGEAFLVGPDIEDKESSGVRTVKSELGRRMRVVKEEGREEWSWKREVTGHFGNVSPGMRGTFANPPPGQPVSQPYDDKNLKLGQKVEDLEDPVARSNFRVVVIKPEEVESVDLSDPETARRQVYRFDSGTQEWSHEECWP